MADRYDCKEMEMKEDACLQTWGRIVFYMVILLTIAGVTAMALWMGNINQDEGWYLYAARNVARGQMLYGDFAYTQGPVLPLFYSVLYRWGGQSGLLGGRLLTAGLGLVAIFFYAGSAYNLSSGRRNRHVAVWLVLLLCGVNLYQAYYFSVVKTYALTSMFMGAGVFFLTLPGVRMRNAFIAGIFMALAGATRVSSLAVGGVIGLCLMWHYRKNAVVWMTYAFGAILGLGVLFAPYVWRCPENLFFGLWEYHQLRTPPDLGQTLILKAGSISRLVQVYFMACCLCLGGGGFLFMKRVCRNEKDLISSKKRCIFPVYSLWLGALAGALLHWTAPYPYDDYQVIVYPVFVLALALLIHGLIDMRGVNVLWTVGVLWVCCIAFVGSSPLLQEWMVRGREGIWWRTKPVPDLVQLRREALSISDAIPSDDQKLLLTQDIYLAIEAGLDVPRGLELGPFSFYPDWSRQQAESMHVVNADMMRELIETCGAPMAAVSGYTFTMASPEVVPVSANVAQQLDEALTNSYILQDIVDHFGQGSTRLKIYRRVGNKQEEGHVISGSANEYY